MIKIKATVNEIENRRIIEENQQNQKAGFFENIKKL